MQRKILGKVELMGGMSQANLKQEKVLHDSV